MHTIAMGPTDCGTHEDGGLTMPDTLTRVDIDPVQAQRGLPPSRAQ